MKLAVVIGAVALLVSACGSDPLEGTSTPTPGPTASASSTSAASATATASTVAREGAAGTPVTPGAAGANASAGANAATPGTPSGASGATPVIPAGTAAAVAPAGIVLDLTRLPIGDNKYASAPTSGAVWTCMRQTGGGGAFTEGPWINADGTYNLNAKVLVDGAVRWEQQLSITRSGSSRVIAGNGLPSHATGTYPIASSDDAYRYDRNPNRIMAQSLRYTLPADPAPVGNGACVGGIVGVGLNGVPIYNAFDAAGRDAVAREVQDGCGGHPQREGQYHYHSVSACLDDSGSGHSPLVGYAFDGFGIFGYRGEGGVQLATANLDACHGHTHSIPWDGSTLVMFHYHATYDFPYTVGCFRGQAAAR